MSEEQEIKPIPDPFWSSVENRLLTETTLDLEPEKIKEWVGWMREFAEKIENDSSFWPEGVSDFKRSLLKNVAYELERRGKIKS